jgi:thiamine-phosphate pyrophosphorylase
MPRRHPALPRLWLLTDERQGDALWSALRRLPRGSGVIVRHYSLPPKERVALFRRIRRLGHGLVLAWSGTEAQAQTLSADAVYGTDPRPGRLPRLYPVHNAREITAADRADAALLFLSPVFPTRTHPGARPLGPLRFARLARTTGKPVVALGGMTSPRGRRMLSMGACGWAAVDGLSD